MASQPKQGRNKPAKPSALSQAVTVQPDAQRFGNQAGFNLKPGATAVGLSSDSQPLSQGQAQAAKFGLQATNLQPAPDANPIASGHLVPSDTDDGDTAASWLSVWTTLSTLVSKGIKDENAAGQLVKQLTCHLGFFKPPTEQSKQQLNTAMANKTRICNLINDLSDVLMLDHMQSKELFSQYFMEIRLDLRNVDVAQFLKKIVRDDAAKEQLLDDILEYYHEERMHLLRSQRLVMATSHQAVSRARDSDFVSMVAAATWKQLLAPRASRGETHEALPSNTQPDMSRVDVMKKFQKYGINSPAPKTPRAVRSTSGSTPVTPRRSPNEEMFASKASSLPSTECKAIARRRQCVWAVQHLREQIEMLHILLLAAKDRPDCNDQKNVARLLIQPVSAQYVSEETISSTLDVDVVRYFRRIRQLQTALVATSLRLAQVFRDASNLSMPGAADAAVQLLSESKPLLSAIVRLARLRLRQDEFDGTLETADAASNAGPWILLVAAIYYPLRLNLERVREENHFDSSLQQLDGIVPSDHEVEALEQSIFEPRAQQHADSLIHRLGGRPYVVLDGFEHLRILATRHSFSADACPDDLGVSRAKILTEAQAAIIPVVQAQKVICDALAPFTGLLQLAFDVSPGTRMHSVCLEIVSAGARTSQDVRHAVFGGLLGVEHTHNGAHVLAAQAASLFPLEPLPFLRLATECTAAPSALDETNQDKLKLHENMASFLCQLRRLPVRLSLDSDSIELLTPDRAQFDDKDGNQTHVRVEADIPVNFALFPVQLSAGMIGTLLEMDGHGGCLVEFVVPKAARYSGVIMLLRVIDSAISMFGSRAVEQTSFEASQMAAEQAVRLLANLARHSGALDIVTRHVSNVLEHPRPQLLLLEKVALLMRVCRPPAIAHTGLWAACFELLAFMVESNGPQVWDAFLQSGVVSIDVGTDLLQSVLYQQERRGGTYDMTCAFVNFIRRVIKLFAQSNCMDKSFDQLGACLQYIVTTVFVDFQRWHYSRPQGLSRLGLQLLRLLKAVLELPSSAGQKIATQSAPMLARQYVLSMLLREPAVAASLVNVIVVGHSSLKRLLSTRNDLEANARLEMLELAFEVILIAIKIKPDKAKMTALESQLLLPSEGSKDVPLRHVSSYILHSRTIGLPVKAISLLEQLCKASWQCRGPSIAASLGDSLKPVTTSLVRRLETNSPPRIRTAVLQLVAEALASQPGFAQQLLSIPAEKDTTAKAAESTADGKRRKITISACLDEADSVLGKSDDWLHSEPDLFLASLQLLHRYFCSRTGVQGVEQEQFWRRFTSPLQKHASSMPGKNSVGRLKAQALVFQVIANQLYASGTEESSHIADGLQELGDIHTHITAEDVLLRDPEQADAMAQLVSAWSRFMVVACAAPVPEGTRSWRLRSDQRVQSLNSISSVVLGSVRNLVAAFDAAAGQGIDADVTVTQDSPKDRDDQELWPVAARVALDMAHLLAILARSVFGQGQDGVTPHVSQSQVQTFAHKLCDSIKVCADRPRLTAEIRKHLFAPLSMAVGALCSSSNDGRELRPMAKELTELLPVLVDMLAADLDVRDRRDQLCQANLSLQIQIIANTDMNVDSGPILRRTNILATIMEHMVDLTRHRQQPELVLVMTSFLQCVATTRDGVKTLCFSRTNLIPGGVVHYVSACFSALSDADSRDIPAYHTVQGVVEPNPWHLVLCQLLRVLIACLDEIKNAHENHFLQDLLRLLNAHMQLLSAGLQPFKHDKTSLLALKRCNCTVALFASVCRHRRYIQPRAPGLFDVPGPVTAAFGVFQNLVRIWSSWRVLLRHVPPQSRAEVAMSDSTEATETTAALKTAASLTTEIFSNSTPFVKAVRECAVHIFTNTLTIARVTLVPSNKEWMSQIQASDVVLAPDMSKHVPATPTMGMLITATNQFQELEKHDLGNEAGLSAANTHKLKPADLLWSGPEATQQIQKATFTALKDQGLYLLISQLVASISSGRGPSMKEARQAIMRLPSVQQHVTSPTKPAPPTSAKSEEELDPIAKLVNLFTNYQ